jgi:hypothetical protein
MCITAALLSVRNELLQNKNAPIDIAVCYAGTWEIDELLSMKFGIADSY